MMILLGFILAAALISLPVLVWGLSRRLDASLATFNRLEKRTELIEQQLAKQYLPAFQPGRITDTQTGGVDVTAAR